MKKKITLLKVFMTLCLLLVGIGNVWGEVTPLKLPKTWSDSDGKSAYTEALGCTLSGLGSDYSSAPKLKFDNQGDYMIIQLADTPDEISFNIKGNSVSGTYSFKVQESTDGSSYSDALNITSVTSSSVKKTASLQSNTRYIKLIYATKGSGNMGLGGISITKGSSKTLESIAISGTPTKTTYEAGEEFDPAGLVVTGTYSEGDPEVITSGITWNSTPNPLTAGTTSVSVTAKVGDITSDAYQVNGLTVKEFVQTYANTYTSDASLSSVITGSKVKWEGCKVTDGYAALKIAKGETANITVPAGTKTVHLHMVAWNGESAAVTVKLGSTTLPSITPTADAGVSGTSTTYTIATEPKTENSYYFAIEVNADEATTLSLTTASNKRAILFGVNFEASTEPSIEADVEEIEFEQKELSGTVTDGKVISATGKNLTAAISASMKSGSAAVFSVTPVGTPTTTAGEFTVSYSATEAGEYAGTVVLSSGEASVEIPVSASVVSHIPVLQSIYVKGEPTKKEYTAGDSFETAGLEVWGKYDEGADQQLTEGIEWVVDPETFETAGTVSVDVLASVGSITSDIYTVNNITVNEAPKVVTFSGESTADVTFTKGSNSDTGAIWYGSPCAKGVITLSGSVTSGTNYSYYDGTVVRFYTNNNIVLTPANGYKITRVEIVRQSTTSNNTGTISCDKLTADESNTTTNTNIFTGITKGAVTFTVNAQARFMSIAVTYAVATPSAENPTITPSAEEDTYWEPITVTLSCATEGASVYYTTDGTEPTKSSSLYKDPISVSATTTIKAIAFKDGLDDSEIATKTFNFGPIFNSLSDLAAATLTKGTIVKVTLTNEVIKSISGKSVYFDIQKGGSDIQIYGKSNAPANWKANGTLCGTLKCAWTQYNNSWELTPDTWDGLTYTDPAIASVTISEGEGVIKTYIEGQTFSKEGLIATGAYISGGTTDLTNDSKLTWNLPQLTLGQTSAQVTATYKASDDAQAINSNTLTIEGLVVTPARVLTGIEITTEPKKSFWVGDTFTTEGMVVKASFEGEQEAEDVTALCEITPVLAKLTEADNNKEISVSYTEGAVTMKQTYSISVKWMTLSDLVENITPTSTAVKVTVKLDNEIIKSLPTKGVTINVKYGEEQSKDIQIYVNAPRPAEYETTGTLTGVLEDCDWKLYSGTWELCPADWSELTYTAPKEYAINIDNLIPHGEIEANEEKAKVGVEVTLTITPEDGYKLSDGTLKVTYGESSEIIPTLQDDGTYKFTMPASDVTVSATFEAIPTHEAKFFVNGVQSGETQNVPEGGEVVFPAEDPADIGTKSFVGWTASPMAEVSDVAPEFVKSATMGTEDLNFYAVFAKKTEGDGNYEKVTTQLSDWRGSYLIAYSDEVFMDGSLAGGASGVGKAQTHVDPEDALSEDKNSIAAAWGDKHYVTIEAINDADLTKGYVIKSHSATTPYFYHTNNTGNGMSGTDEKSTAADYPITVTFNSVDDIAIALGGNATGAILHYNKSTGTSGEMFRYYKNGGQSPIYLYKKHEATYSGYCTDVPVTATITSTGYATFSCDYALDLDNLPEGLTAYFATYNENANTIHMEVAKGIVPAKTGLFLGGEASTQYSIPVTADEATTPENNILKPTGYNELVAGDYVYYISTADFRPITNETLSLSAGKAYIPKEEVSAEGSVAIDFGGESTGIKERMDNGQWTDDHTPVFNLQGVRVTTPKRGEVYIKNGKKYMMK